MSNEFSLKELLQELAEQRKFDFRGYKPTTLERRLRKRMFSVGIGDYAAYAKFLRDRPDEINQLLNTILINVTEFFRDPPAWEILRNEILPSLIRQLKPGASFRVWSAGCASGEEPYSIAILLAELLGRRLAEYDVKIYATDIDDEALNTARHGEYSTESVRTVRSEWRDKYFYGREGAFRVNREIRRLVIFGHGNLAEDAPISHVDLLVCRNVLIYFDADLQRSVLSRLHYALSPRGILFLGKSESQLSNSAQFRRLNARWRIFQRISSTDEVQVISETSRMGQQEALIASPQELDAVRLQQQHILETMRPGVVILGANDVITNNNAAALTLYGLPPANLVGKRLQDTELFMRTPELGSHLHASSPNNDSSRFQTRIKAGNEEKVIEVILRPVLDGNGKRSGTFIYCEDVTAQEKLQATIEELRSTSDELQSANEELETTNEELQSTNEELETTNEELQSTNEELETTNEELQSLNEEMESTNQELAEQGKDLDQVNTFYSRTLETIRLPVMLLDQNRRIEFWNSMASRMFGFKSKPPMELQVEQLPLPEPLRKMIMRNHREVLGKHIPIVARRVRIGGKINQLVDLHFSLISEDRTRNVLLMFEPRMANTRPDGKRSHKRSSKRRVRALKRRS